MGIALLLAAASGIAQTQPEVGFGGSYANLSRTQQGFVNDWVRRFGEVTGQKVDPGEFFDNFVRISTRTTFDAITNALSRTTLTDESGASLGTALDLVESVDTVRGKVRNASGDHQFRMYVTLRADAYQTLQSSKEFRRTADNTVYHKGYPINFRQQGGAPSIQFSMALDRRRSDIDVDYRSSSFPQALFDGHLTAGNSDVRAGNDDERHRSRWEGLTNWWRGFFGVGLSSDYDDVVADKRLQFPEAPRAGKATIEKMTRDFLSAWLLEGNLVEAMGYVSERAYPCIALESRQPESFDRGMAPFILLNGMKRVHDALGSHESLEGLTLGVRLTDPALKVVDQPYHPQFVIYSVPDDVAVSFDCASRSNLGASRRVHQYGNYFGTVFFLQAPAGRGETVALLWGKEGDYWKIVSYETEVESEEEPLAKLPVTEDVAIARVEADETLVRAARDFLEQWFSRKRYDDAFKYLSTRSYSCYNRFRHEHDAEASSDAKAGTLIRTSMEKTGEMMGPRQSLDEILEGVESTHPAVRVVTQPYEDTFTLVSFPNAITEWADCAAHRNGDGFPDPIPLEYGEGFGLYFRLRTEGGETPVYRALWARENGEWKITAFSVEAP